jgi:hypothetical protein
VLKNGLGNKYRVQLSELLWARPFNTKAVSFAIVMASMVQFSCVLLALHIVVP